MTTPERPPDLIVSFPAAGAGGTTLEQVELLAVRRGMAYLALSNPASVEALVSGTWQAGAVEEICRAVERVSAGRAILIGHCMGGLSAVRLAHDLGERVAVPVRTLVVNTPCPDAAGRIPTMSRLSDAAIARILAQDGFPQELLDDEDMLAEIARGLRADATVADRIAEWVSSAGELDRLDVLSTRGDPFVKPEWCAGWQHRVSREFRLTVTPGGHTLDEASIGILERAVESVISDARVELV